MSFDFDAAVSTPHRMQPGLHRLAPSAAQLTPTITLQRWLARRAQDPAAAWVAAWAAVP